MTPLLDNLVAFFSEQEWTFEQAQGQSVLRLAFDGQNGRFLCYAHAHEDLRQVVFYAAYPKEIPESLRGEIAAMLMRANFDLTFGNFELDWDDGQLRFRTSLDVEGSTLVPSMLRNLTLANVVTMDRLLPAITSVLEGESPRDALERAFAEHA